MLEFSIWNGKKQHPDFRDDANVIQCELVAPPEHLHGYDSYTEFLGYTRKFSSTATLTQSVEIEQKVVNGRWEATTNKVNAKGSGSERSSILYWEYDCDDVCCRPSDNRFDETFTYSYTNDYGAKTVIENWLKTNPVTTNDSSTVTHYEFTKTFGSPDDSTVVVQVYDMSVSTETGVHGKFTVDRTSPHRPAETSVGTLDDGVVRTVGTMDGEVVFDGPAFLPNAMSYVRGGETAAAPVGFIVAENGGVTVGEAPSRREVGVPQFAVTAPAAA